MSTKKINPLRVKARIIEQGLRIEDLAIILKINRTSASNRVTGRVPFTANELGVISSWLGCSIDEFYN